MKRKHTLHVSPGKSGNTGNWFRFPSMFTLFCILFLQSSCSNFNGTPVEGLLGAPTNVITFSHDLTDELVAAAMPPLVAYRSEMAILVTTFVDNNDLEKTGQFGRMLQEHIATRLVQLGYPVRENRIAQTVTIAPGKGETILSRDLSKLQPDLNAQAIVVGTLSRSGRYIYIASRVVNPVSGNIVASVDKRLYMDDSMLHLFGLRTTSKIETPVDEPSAPLLNSVL